MRNPFEFFRRKKLRDQLLADQPCRRGVHAVLRRDPFGIAQPRACTAVSQSCFHPRHIDSAFGGVPSHHVRIAQILTGHKVRLEQALLEVCEGLRQIHPDPLRASQSSPCVGDVDGPFQRHPDLFGGTRQHGKCLSLPRPDSQSFGRNIALHLKGKFDHGNPVLNQNSGAVPSDIRIRTTEVVPNDRCLLRVNFFHLTRIARLIVFCLAGPVLAQQTQYFSTLEKLSEPAATRWQHFGPPYFSTNEKLLNRFYSRFDGMGGATVGVSFQQNFSILVHARPQLCVVFDFNPGVTEILVPFMGQLLTENATRAQFLSALLGAPITGDETRRMLEGQATVNAVLTTVLERTPAEKRKGNLEHLRGILRDRYLARLPAQATPYIRKEALGWIDVLENQELLTGRFFADAIAPYTLAHDPDSQRRMSGWLSREDNYALVREYWVTGRIIGITGDISGSSVPKLAAYLRERHLQATVLYTSNVGSTVDGHFPEAWFRDLYAALGQLPVRPATLTFISQGPWQLTGYVRSLQTAQWVYSTLADVPVEVGIRLNEAPLEILTQLGPGKLLAGIDRGLQTLNAPAPYRELLKQIQNNQSDIREMKPDRFREWAARQSPGVDPNSPIFKTVWVTLAEAGFVTRD